MNKELIGQLWEWRYELNKIGLVGEDRISLGNLAYFIDRLSKEKEQEIMQNKIRLLMGNKDRVSVAYYIATFIGNNAEKEGIGDCLDFRLEKIHGYYWKDTLNHFDILLDDFDFPDWFHEIEYSIPADFHEIKKDIMQRLKGLEIYQEFSSNREILVFLNSLETHNRWDVFSDIYETITKDESKVNTYLFFLTAVFSMYYAITKKNNWKAIERELIKEYKKCHIGFENGEFPAIEFTKHFPRNTKV